MLDECVRRMSGIAFAILAAMCCGAVPVDNDADGIDDAIDVCPNTPPPTRVTVDGRPLGDIDLDCDVDLLDFQILQDTFTGPCLPEICDDRMDNDCDGLIDCADLDECPLNTPCGGANEACVAGGVCGCLVGYDDCDGLADTGCETDVTNDPANCGGCDFPCALPHTTTICSTSECVITGCEQLWGNCDGLAENGCERSLTTLSDCRTCNTICALPNANESCSSGMCRITSCVAFFVDCDGDHSNGCEHRLPNPCP